MLREMFSLKAHAKINLSLEVTGRRSDGYHEISTVLQTVDLWDLLTFELADSITLECDNADLQSPDNLVLRAAHMLREESGAILGARIRLEKGIPVAAGLGGGSSDAAATLKGLGKLWGLTLPEGGLAAMAARLGSDVSFFLHGGTALAQGRGERILPLPPASIEWLVILDPEIRLPQKTSTLYSLLSPDSYTRALLTNKLAGRIRGGGDVPPQFLFNTFDEVAYAAFPGLDKYRDAFHSAGATEVHLAGSGPCLFSLVPRREVGTAIQLLLQYQYGMNAHLVTRWDPSPEQDGE